MLFDTNIIDLLDELDLDIQGFEDVSPGGSLLFPVDLCDPSEASTSTLDVASTDVDPPAFELLEEIELGPRVWVAAGPPIWDSLSTPVAAHSAVAQDAPLCRASQSLIIDLPPCTPSRTLSRPLPKENLASPTERAFARLRDRGSSLALRALNLALASPEIHHRVLV